MITYNLGRRSLNSTLESTVIAGFEAVGTIGVSYDYLVGDLLPLNWRVRVLTDEGELLENAPYSLAFNSPCCHNNIHTSWDKGEVELTICAACDKPITSNFASELAGPLSLLGRNREYSLSRIETVAANVFSLDPLEAILVARGIAENIELVHEEFMTKEWAADTAYQVQSVYPKR